MSKPKKDGTVTIRDRIKELRRVPARDLKPSPYNWRRHSQAQRDALKGVLTEIGYAGALLARELPDGSLELCDGHCRADLTPDQDVPVLVLDVDEREAKYLLATLDPLGAMAEADQEALGVLLADVSSADAAVQAMLDSLYESPTEKDVREKGERLTLDDISEDNPKLAAFIRAKEASLLAGQDRNQVGFWLCLVFQSYEQKQEFLKALPDLKTKYGLYVDGEEFAKRFGVIVTPNTMKPITSVIEGQLASLVIPS